MNDLELLGLKTICERTIKRMQVVETGCRSNAQKEYVLDTSKDMFSVLKALEEKEK